MNIHTRTPMQTSFAGETSFGSSSSPLASGSGTARIGNWGASLAGKSFNTNGYISVPESARGSVDTPVASEHQSGDLMLEHATKNVREFLRGNLFGESRDNGTVKQFNHTTIRQLAIGTDWQNSSGSLYASRLRRNAVVAPDVQRLGRQWQFGNADHRPAGASAAIRILSAMVEIIGASAHAGGWRRRARHYG